MPLQLQYQGVDLILCQRNRVGEEFAADFLPFNGDLMDLGDADKPECGDQRRFKVV